MSQFQVPPDPAGSPLEKLVTQRRLITNTGFRAYLQEQGVDPELAEKIGAAIDQWERDRDYERLQQLNEWEVWANIHTHELGGGSPGGTPPEHTDLVYIGGQGPTDNSVDTIYHWNNLSGWVLSADTLVLALSHISGQSVVLDNKVYIFGGWDTVGATWVPDVQVYDPTAGTVNVISSFPGIALGRYGVVSDHSRYIYLFGGTLTNSRTYTDGHVEVKETWRFDTQTNTWLQLVDMPWVTYIGQGIVSGDTIIVSAYGTPANPDTALLYDISANAWAINGSYTITGSDHASGVVSNNLVVFTRTSFSPRGVFVDLSTADETGTIPEPTYSQMAVAVTEGTVLHAVGGLITGTEVTRHEIYDHDASTWSNAGDTLPEGRVKGALHAVTLP